MAKACSVSPQIWHKGQLVDSEAFNQLWQIAKTNSTNPFEAREKAKSDYYSMFDPSFKDNNGDWELLYKLNNNVMSDKDHVLFNSVYKGNKQLLESSIKVKLNSQGEPAILVGSQASTSFHYVNEDSDYLSNDDQAIMNRVFAKMIILTFEKEGKLNLLNLTAADFSEEGSIKDMIIRELEQIYVLNKNVEIAKIVKYLKEDDKNVWRLFKGYFLSKFNMKIKDVTDFDLDEEYENSKEVKVDRPGNWDDSQLNRDHTLTAGTVIKFELMKAYYSESEKLNKETETPFGTGVNKFNVSVPIDPDDLWNQILSINYGAHTKEEILLHLRFASDIKFNGALESFLKRLENEDDFYNLFYQTAKLAIFEDVTLVVDKDYEKENTAYFDVVTNNRKSKASNVAYDTLLDKIQRNVKIKNHNLKDIIEMSNSYNNKTALDYKLDVVRNLASLLGIDLADYHIGFYLKTKGVDVDYLDLRSSLLEEARLKQEDANYLEGPSDNYNNIVSELASIKADLDAIAYSVFKAYGKDYSKLKKSKDPGYIAISSSKQFYLNSASKPALNKIAELTKVDYAKMSSMSYYNSKFDRQQSPQYNSFLSDFFDGIIAGRGVTISKDTILNRFKDYIEDPRLDYDNFLWQDVLETDVNTGMFYPNWDGDKKVVDRINEKIFEKLGVVQIDGNRYSNSSSGDGYKDLRDDNWNLTEIIYQMYGYYLIPTSDSGRMYGIKKKFERFESMIGKNSFDNRGRVYSTDIYENSDFQSTRLYRYLENNILQEFKDIQLTFTKLYDVDYYLQHDILRPNDNYKTKESRKGLLKGIEVSEDLELVKNNRPTGNVFNKTNLVFVEDGISKTLATEFAENGYDAYFREILKMDLGKGVPAYAQEIMTIFFAKWMQFNQEATANALSYIKEDIIRASRNRMDTSDTTNQTDESEIIKNSFVSLPKDSSNMTDEERADWAYNVACLNLFLNNHLNTVIFGNLLFGNVTEYKSMVNWNKRVNQTIRNGASTPSTETYNQVVCEDINLKSNMLDLFKNDPTISKKDYKILEERYKNEIVTTNAIDYITDVEFFKRLHAFGVYDKYESLIADLQDETKPFNVKAYLHLVEQLKYFSYTRKKVGDRVISVQNKNSTVVLFKRLVKGTEKEIMYDFMKQNDIHDINTSEGHKLGGVIPIRLHNEDGRINTDILKMSKEDVKRHSIELSYNSLRIQLDVVPHLENKENRIATQLIKKTLDNLIENNNYDTNRFAGGNKMKGRTRNFKDGERGVFEEFHYCLSYNAEHAAMELLNDFGAIKNGKINMSEDGTSIIVDMKKVSHIIEDYFLENSTDFNIIKAVGINKDGTSNLPYHHPSLLRLIESVLEAKITNKVTRQRIFGSHVAIQPDMFNNPIKPVQDTTNQDTHYTYTKEFLKSSDTRKDGRKLRSEYTDENGVYHPAEIVINPFDKRFYRPEFMMDDGTGRVDINKIKAKDPKLLILFGTRIPHEGDQSSFVGEIVGFIQNGASTAITPDHLIARTGWDFDIDTVYLYHYATDSKFNTYDMYDESDQAMNRRFNNFIKTFYPEQYNANASKLLYENYKLYQEIKAINKATNIAVEKSPSYVHAMTNLSSKIDRLNKAISKHEAGTKILTDEELKVKQESLKNSINRYNELSVGVSGKKALKKIYEDFQYVPEVISAVKSRVTLLKGIEEKIKSNIEESSEYSKFKESVRSEFEKLDKVKQATKEERNNRILDMFIALHSDKTNNLDREKPNEMDHISSASDFVNGLLGFNTKNAHPTNLADKLYFRNLNMNVATLKESSVAYDNILAVMNVLKAVNVKHKVPAVIRVSEIFGYDPLNEINTLNDILDKNFGSGNWTKNEDLIYIKNIGFIGNNFEGEGVDIQSQRISEQRTELTSNILDAVSKLMVNLNQDSFGIFAYLASTPLSYYTNIHKNGKEAEVNRYIYPSLFISQPIVQELTKLTVANNRFGDRKSSFYNVSIVRENYLSKIIDVLLKETSFEKYLELNAKSFSLSEKESNSILEKSPKANIDMINERIRGDFEETRQGLIDYKNKGNAGRIDYKILNRFLAEQDFETIESRPYTLGVLKRNIERGRDMEKNPIFDLEHIDFYIEQLSTLEYYTEVERAASDVVNLMGVFNTDKLGASPNSGVSNKLLNNIVKFDKNFGEFESYLKNILDNDFTADSYNTVIKNIRDGVHSRVSIVDKMSYLDEVYNFYEFKNSIAPIRTKSGKSVTKAVYGDLFVNKNPDYLKSEYPYLAAQAIWTNIFSTKLYNNVMLSENPTIKSMLNRTLASMDSINDDKVRYRLLMYLINNSVKNISFFDADYSKILTTAKQEVEELIDSNTGKKIASNVVSKLDEFTSIQKLNASLTPFEDFSKLTLANQIMLLLNKGLNTAFMRWISPNLSQENINKKGFVELTISDTDSNINEARSDFKRMYNSTNEYDRLVAENIIRYGFITNGLQFGSSVSKYIDTDIFFDEKETGNRKNDLHTMADIMRNIENIPSNLTEQDIDAIHKSNWDNEKINPVMDKTIYFSKGKARVNTNRPTWKFTASTLNKVKYEGKDERVEHLIFEYKNFVDESKYANNEYLVKEYNVGTTTSKVLFKRYSEPVGEFYIYYPINRTLAFEYNNSVIDMFNKFPINTKLGSIAKPSDYYSIINNISITNGKAVKVDNSNDNLSYSSEIKKLHDESDIVLFVGDRTSDRGKLTLNTLPNGKVFSLTEKEFIAKGFIVKNRIKKDSAYDVTIVGDDILKSEENDMNAALVKFVAKNNINKIKTIVSKANAEKSMNNIIMSSSELANYRDVKTINQFSTYFNEVEFAPSSKDAAVMSMMSEIKDAEINILTIARRLKKHVENYKVDAISSLDQIVNESKNVIDNLDIAFPSMSAVSDVVKTNKILYKFIVYSIEQSLDEISDTDVTKFTQSQHYKEMIKYSNKLEEMFNYLLVAEHTLSMPTYSETQLSNLSDEDKAIISSYNSAILSMQEDINYINTLKETVGNLINNYHSVQIIARSRNANYVESIYSHAVNYLLSEGYNLDEIPKLKITPEDIARVTKRMLNNNEDIGWFASKLDSSRDTYITLPDILGKIYAETLYRSHADAIRQIKHFNELLSTVYKDTSKDYNSDRESWFVKKFVTDEGELISEYNYSLYKDKIKALYELKAIYQAKRFEARRNKDVEAFKSYTNELNKLRPQIARLHTKIEIKENDPTYNFHYEAWSNIPEKHKRTYEINNQIKFVESDYGLRIFRYIPSDEFKSKEFAKLTEEEMQFLMTLKETISSLVKNVFPTYELSNGFIPYAFNSTLKGDIKRMFGVAKKGKESFFVNLQGEVQYYLDAFMLHSPKTPEVIPIPKGVNALEEINKDREDKFKSIEEVIKYNKDAETAAKLKAKEVRNFDISNLMYDFINQLADVKTVRDFESSYRLALITLGSDDFKATAKTAGGKDIFDNLKRYLSGKNETVKKSGKNTEAYDNLVRMAKPLYNISRTNNNMDMLLNMVVRYTSLGTMAFNVRSGVKNVIVGYTNILNEAISKEFINTNELSKATNDYRKALKHLLADIGKDETNNFTVGLIKHFGTIFEDQSENVSDKSNNIIGKGFRLWDNFAYMSLNSGEHFMQFTMLLGMLKSHRMVIVGNIATYMSLYDFINDRRMSVLKDKLSPELYKELNTYFLENKEKETNATDYVDHIENWLNSNYSRISTETKSEIAKAMIETRKKATEEFNSFETLESQFELKDGLITVKEGSKLDERTISAFADRVRKVNHSLHGIYNGIDRNQLQDSLFGELFMQFRKWMRPTFIRWFGAKYGRTQFSEATGTYRSGAYLDFWKFITMPVKREIRDKNPLLAAIGNIAKGYIEFLQNYSYYYNNLPTHKRANINRALVSISSMAISTMLLYATYALAGGSDDDKKKNMNKFWIASTVYQLSAIQTELFETTPFGWATFYLRSKRNIMASERSITDLAAFFYYTMLYPFQSDEQRNYQTGMYKGNSKAEVRFEKAVPLYRQIHNFEYQSATINYYQMYNPILNLVGN